MARVLITDFPWGEVSLERDLLNAAGHDLVCGAAKAPDAGEVAELARRSDPAAVMTCWAQVRADAIDGAPALRCIQRIGVGLDNIDVDAAARRGVLVTNVPDYCVEEVSDHALGLALCCTRSLVLHDRDTTSGLWEPSRHSLRRLAELTVAIVGFGPIGRRLAQKFGPFGCRVVVVNRSPPTGLPPGARHLPLAEALAVADIISLHLPLNPQTRHMIDEHRLRGVKPGAFLINTARGGLIDNDALLGALGRGALAGAALDVIDGEPTPPAALLGHPAVIATPHVAFSSDASVRELRQRSTEEVIRVLAGEPAHFPCAQA